MTGGSVYGTGLVWELRAVPLAGGTAVLLDSGSISGACGFRLPSAPSRQAAFLYVGVRWASGQRTVRVLRQDPGKRPRALGSPITRRLPSGSSAFAKLVRCGDRTRLTYVVTSRTGGGRVSVSVARASLPKAAR
jgi:hypothetical protein